MNDNCYKFRKHWKSFSGAREDSVLFEAILRHRAREHFITSAWHSRRSMSHGPREWWTADDDVYSFTRRGR